MGCDVALLIGTEPIDVPPVAHPVAEDSTPQSENATVPLQVEVPVTVTVAVSVTPTGPNGRSAGCPIAVASALDRGGRASTFE